MSTPVTVRVNASDWRGTLPHAWTYIGYDECNYTTTPEGEALLREIGRSGAALLRALPPPALHRQRRSARSMGLHQRLPEDEEENPRYEWTGIDGILDTILQAGCKPFVELGFMPRDLADPRLYDKRAMGTGWSNTSAPAGHCPPKDYTRWHDLIRALVAHCVKRHGATEVATWYWELWNEPDLDYYWKGTTEEFCTLYDSYCRRGQGGPARGARGRPGDDQPGGRGAPRGSGRFPGTLHRRRQRGHRRGGTGLDFVSFTSKAAATAPIRSTARKSRPRVRRVLELAATGYEILSRYEGLTALECVLSRRIPTAGPAAAPGTMPTSTFATPSTIPAMWLARSTNCSRTRGNGTGT